MLLKGYEILVSPCCLYHIPNKAYNKSFTYKRIGKYDTCKPNDSSYISAHFLIALIPRGFQTVSQPVQYYSLKNQIGIIVCVYKLN